MKDLLTHEIQQRDYEYFVDLNYKNIQNNTYELSNLGNVRRKDDKYPIKQSIHNSNYGKYRVVSLKVYNKNKSRPFLVHRLVASTFIKNNDNKKNQVDHKNNNGMDNKDNNLQWVTPKENTLNIYKHNLTNEENYLIYTLVSKGLNNFEIMYNLGLPISSYYSNIIDNIRLSYLNNTVSFDYSDAKANSSKYSDNQLHEICKKIVEGKSYINIAEEMNIDISDYNKKRSFNAFICNIRNKKHNTRISKFYNFKNNK